MDEGRGVACRGRMQRWGAETGDEGEGARACWMDGAEERGSEWCG